MHTVPFNPPPPPLFSWGLLTYFKYYGLMMLCWRRSTFISTYLTMAECPFLMLGPGPFYITASGSCT